MRSSSVEFLRVLQQPADWDWLAWHPDVSQGQQVQQAAFNRFGDCLNKFNGQDFVLAPASQLVFRTNLTGSSDMSQL